MVILRIWGPNSCRTTSRYRCMALNLQSRRTEIALARIRSYLSVFMITNGRPQNAIFQYPLFCVHGLRTNIFLKIFLFLNLKMNQKRFFINHHSCDQTPTKCDIIPASIKISLNRLIF